MFQIIFQNLPFLLITQSKTQRCTSDSLLLRLVWPHLLPSTTTASLHSKLALRTWNFPRWTKVECQCLTFEQGHRKSQTSSEKVQPRTSTSINLERRQTTIKRPHLESRVSPCQSVHGGTNAMKYNFTLTTR
jgi:hypothetical protein